MRFLWLSQTYRMGWKCCVPGCNSGYVSNTKSINTADILLPKPSFHSFPVDNEMKKKWLSAIHRKDYVVTNSSRVCSKPFYATDFKEKTEDGNTTRSKNKVIVLKLLKSGAVPKIFENQPAYLTVKKSCIALKAQLVLADYNWRMIVIRI